MLDPITGKHVVGIKQSDRAIRAGQVSAVHIALDAEERVTAPIRSLCREHGVPVYDVPTMSELGRAAGIEINAAVVAVLR